MITRHGPKTIKIEKLKLPGDIKQRQASKHVQDLAKSMDITGGAPLNPPTVDKETMRVVTGCDRIAALMLLKTDKVTVELVSGEPIDLARATIAENLYRRQEDRDQLIKDLVDLETPRNIGQLARKSPSPAKDGTKRGRPPGERKAAIKKIAEEKGISEDAVRRADNRVREEEKKAAEPAQPEIIVPPLPTIRTLGLDVPADVMAAAEKEQGLVDKMDRLLSELNRTYTAYQDVRGERVGLKTGQRHQTALKDAFDAFSTIRGQRPASVCPHCKLWPEIRKTCACCRSTGFVGKFDLEGVEKCLLAEGDEAGVWVATEGKRPQWRTMISMRGEDF
jgi:hypothetical protein